MNDFVGEPPGSRRGGRPPARKRAGYEHKACSSRLGLRTGSLRTVSKPVGGASGYPHAGA